MTKYLALLFLFISTAASPQWVIDLGPCMSLFTDPSPAGKSCTATITPFPTTTDTIAPVVTLIAPASGASQLINTTVQVSATITDNVGVTRSELLWVNGASTFTVNCATPQSPFTCVQSGTTYTWSIPIASGTGARSWSVRGRDLAGNVTTSAVRTITITATPPPAPTAILSWDAPPGTVTGYRVYYGTAPGVYLQPKGSGIPTGNVLGWTISTGLNPGTLYYFAVTAYNDDGESAYSNEATKLMP